MWPIQIAWHIDDQLGLNWKTVVEVARVLPKGATITGSELMGRTEDAKAVNSLTKTEKIQFDLGGNLVEEWKKRRQTDKRQIEEIRDNSIPGEAGRQEEGQTNEC